MKLAEIRKAFQKASEALAAQVSKKDPDIQAVIEGMEISRTFEKVLKEDSDQCKKVLIPILKASGTVPEGQKQRVFTIGNWRLAMHPTRSGLDSDKVQAALVSMKKPLDKFLVESKVYSLPPAGSEQDSKLRKLFTGDELKALEYDESWTVKTPTEEK